MNLLATKSRAWARRWLLCAGFFYPLYLLSLVGLYAVPGYLQSALFGYRIESVRVWHLDVSVRAVEYAEGHEPAVRVTEGPGKVMLAALLLGGAMLGLAAWRPRFRCLGGLAAACVAQAALPTVLMPLMQAGGWRWPHGAYFLGLFAMLALGIRAVACSTGAASVWGRVAAGWLLFVAPLAILWSIAGSPRLLAEGWFLGLQLAPAALASLAAGGLGALREQHTSLPGWKPIAAGALLTLVSAYSVQAAREATRGSAPGPDPSPLDSAPPLPEGPIAAEPAFQKGVNFTSEGRGGYGSRNAEKVLDKLVEYGVNSIAIVPYGFAPGGGPELRFPGGLDRDEGVAYVSRLAHARGISVMLKPQVWFRGGYPGDIDFPDPEQRRIFFENYARFVEHYSKLATSIHAEMFCVGVEFVHLTRYEDEWRLLFALAREHYQGPLVYAANFGVEFERVAFWDDLDYIGLDNYYPLPDDRSMDEIVRKIETVQRRFGKPLIFTEAGFPSIENGHREPWLDRFGTLAHDEQAANIDALFRAFYDKPWFRGVYWWKIGNNGFGGLDDASHTPWGKPAMEVIKSWYTSDAR